LVAAGVQLPLPKFFPGADFFLCHSCFAVGASLIHFLTRSVVHLGSDLGPRGNDSPVKPLFSNDSLCPVARSAQSELKAPPLWLYIHSFSVATVRVVFHRSALCQSVPRVSRLRSTATDRILRLGAGPRQIPFPVFIFLESQRRQRPPPLFCRFCHGSEPCCLSLPRERLSLRSICQVHFFVVWQGALAEARFLGSFFCAIDFGRGSIARLGLVCTDMHFRSDFSFLIQF
jgi:hypothetical protein